MATKDLTVKLPDDIYQRFVNTVTARQGRWSGRGALAEIVDSTVTAALVLFLRDVKRETDLPEFRAYASEKYPELDEYLVSLIENLIEQGKRPRP